jgi:hypothetical protein
MLASLTTSVAGITINPQVADKLGGLERFAGRQRRASAPERGIDALSVRPAELACSRRLYHDWVLPNHRG